MINISLQDTGFGKSLRINDDKLFLNVFIPYENLCNMNLIEFTENIIGKLKTLNSSLKRCL